MESKFRFFFLCVLIVMWTATRLEAQTKVSDSTRFAFYSGTESVSMIQKDSLQERSGSYTFQSELIPTLARDTILLNELVINGTYRQNLKEGTWNFKFNTYSLEDISIRRSWNATFRHTLNGVEDEYKMRYKQGRFDGTSTYARSTITNGRFGNPTQLSMINFESDTIIGVFKITVDDVEISGQTDDHGFLDGTLSLHYGQAGTEVIEKRTYKNGFLLEVEKRNAATDEPLATVIYDDVISMLSKIEVQEEQLDFKVSDKFFGLQFNNGYQNEDEKIAVQHKGNQLFGKHLSLFDSIHNHYTNELAISSIHKFTSRFEYLYPAEEDSLIAQLYVANEKLNRKLNATLNRPNIVLRKNNTDSLFQHYQILQHIKSKSDTIRGVFDRMMSGYFDYYSRSDYYANGIPGLDENDSITYVFKGDTIALPFKIKAGISDADQLIRQVGEYMSALNHMADFTIINLSESLTIYENQEKIDSLDRVINNLEIGLNDKYEDWNSTQVGNLYDAPFSSKVILSLNERILNDLKGKYLNNSLPQEEMIALGVDLICYYSFLEANSAALDKVGDLQQIWNDSLFTVYRDNPFDFRKLETKILEGAQHAVNILLRHYANQLLNAKSCEQISAELERIDRLDQRVAFLVQNQESDNVQQLNKALRRERVTTRIERLLEL